jgi:exopolyphosphatase/guanosine-5'-triphosphate,3'-diphosphate pyrophosphatase
MANAEIFGLTRDEVNIVALVARYHRRSPPKPTHIEYMTLPREKRMIVSKLAAVLRVADALDRAHARKIRDFTCEHRDEELVLSLPGVADLTLERRAMEDKADLFEDVFGMRLRLEEAQAAMTEDRRAKAVE